MAEGSPGVNSPVMISDPYYVTGPSLDHFLDNKPLPKYQTDYVGENAKLHHPEPLAKLQETLNLPGSIVQIHYDDPPPNSQASQYDLHILNKGLYQQRLVNGYGDNIPNAPDKIVVDVQATVPPGKKGYPFSLNREQLDTSVTRAINDWVNQNIISGHQQRKLSKLQNDYNNIGTLFDHEAGHDTPIHFLDSDNKFTPEEIDLFRSSPALSEGMKAIGGLQSDIIRIADGLGWEKKPSEKQEKFGLLFQEPQKSLLGTRTTLGIHLPNPGNPAKSSIFINLMEILKAAQDYPNPVDHLASELLAVITHETAHLPARGHDTGFAYRDADLRGELGKQNTNRFLDQLASAVGDVESGQINPELLELLRTYDESRARPARGDNDLVSTGTSIEGPENITEGEGTDNEIAPTGEGNTGYLAGQQFGGPRQPLGIQSTPYGMPGEGGGRNKQTPRNARPDRSRSIKALEDALASATPLREQQEQMYTEERGSRLSELLKVKTPGLRGFRQQLGKLKGELPKVIPEVQLDQSHVDNLIDAITDADNLSPWQKLNAKEGIVKLLEGSELPQRSEIALINRALGTNIGPLLEMHGGLGAIGTGLKITRDTVNIPKSLMASFDLSAPFRQGAGLITYPQFWKSFLKMHRLFGDQALYDATMQSLAERPKWSLGYDAGLKLPGVDDMNSKEEQFISRLAETGEFLPEGGLRTLYNVTVGAGVRASDRAYNGFLNKTRADIFDYAIDSATAAGHKVQNTDGSPTKVAKDIARMVNNGSGRGDLGHFNKYADDLNILFFSPRLIASRLNTLNPAWYASLHPFARQMAYRNLLGIAALGGISLALYKAMGADVSLNPLSSDFLKAKFGNLRMDPWAGFQQYVVAASRFINGVATGHTGVGGRGILEQTPKDVVENFFVNKLAPVPKNTYEWLASRVNEAGERINRFGKPMNFKQDLAKLFIPLSVQDLMQIYDENPNLLPAMAPIIYGQGGQVYESNEDQNTPWRVNRLRF